MAIEAICWSLFDDHCFCEANGVCMRQLFADETCYEVPIGHHECVTPPSPRLQEKYHQSSVLSIPSNSDSSTMVNESPRPTHPSSTLMLSHSIAMKAATTALEKLIAVEDQMEGSHLRIVDTVEIDGTGFAPPLVVGDYAYYEIALMTAVAGHGRLRGAYWRVMQRGERLEPVRNDSGKDPMIARPMREEDRKLRLTKQDLDEAHQDLRRQHDTQIIGTTGRDQVASGMKSQHSLDIRQCDAGLPSGEDEPPKEEETATICDFTHPEPDVQFQALQEDDMANDEENVDGCASSGIREWPLGKVVMKVWRLLRYLCGLPISMKLVDSEQGYGEAGHALERFRMVQGFWSWLFVL